MGPVPDLTRPPLSAVRCVVFDFDGTLVDSNAIKSRAYVDAAAQCGCPADIVAEALATTKGDRYAVFANAAARMDKRPAGAAGPAPEDLARTLADAYSRICETEIAACPEIAGATDLLEKLMSAGHRLFVNSATPEHHLRRLIARRDMTRYFHGVLGGRRAKERNLDAIMAAEGVGPAAVLCIGDGEDDRRAAENTDCHYIAVARPEDPDHGRFRRRPAMIVSDLRAIAGPPPAREAVTT